MATGGPRDLEEDDLDRGLAAGFAPELPASLGESVLRSIERGSGAVAAAFEPSPPDEAGRYRIVGEVGRGGIGVVYSGRDRDLDRDVALKVLRPDRVGSAGLARRFVEEARVESWLEHPGVVPVYDVGQVRLRIPYFAMKLVRGRPFSALLKARKLPAEDQRRHLGVFLRVCETVAYAHARGVIHRDLKPGNVMVGEFGEVHVVDWGFAKVRGRDEAAWPAEPREAVSLVADRHSLADGSRSTPGSVMGTPPYMPPEQARGEAVDERADVFALGAILAEILTGKPPYVGEGMLPYFMAAEARLAECFERLDRCGADGEWTGLAKRCLVADRAARPRDAAEVAGAAAALVAAAEEDARRAEVAAASERARRDEADARERVERARETQGRAARRRARLIAAAVLLAVLAGGGFFSARQATERRRAAEGAAAVDAALREASRLEGAGDWVAAEAWAKRAVAAAEARGASATVTAPAEAESSRLAAAAAAARLAEEKRRRNEALLAKLRHVQDSGCEREETAQSLREHGGLLQAFRESGIDFVTLPPEDLARELSVGGLATEFAAILERWAVRTQRIRGGGVRRRDAREDRSPPGPRSRAGRAPSSSPHSGGRRYGSKHVSAIPPRRFASSMPCRWTFRTARRPGGSSPVSPSSAPGARSAPHRSSRRLR